MKLSENEEKNSEQVSWNLSQALINEISSLLLQSNTQYLQGKIDQAFFSLKAIKLRIIQNLSEEECQAFRKLENLSFLKLEKATEQQKLFLIGRNYENYNNLVMRSLQKYGFLIPFKQSSKQMF